MAHHFIHIADNQTIKSVVLLQSANNLDRSDNLDDLPEEAAVYAICGSINNLPVNCRYVGITKNLRLSIKKHFEMADSSVCLQNFMHSIKTKQLIYEVVFRATTSDLEEKKEKWSKLYKPYCSEILNRIY